MKYMFKNDIKSKLDNVYISFYSNYNYLKYYDNNKIYNHVLRKKNSNIISNNIYESTTVLITPFDKILLRSMIKEKYYIIKDNYYIIMD